MHPVPKATAKGQKICRIQSNRDTLRRSWNLAKFVNRLTAKFLSENIAVEHRVISRYIEKTEQRGGGGG